jgi:hypothetical protein
VALELSRNFITKCAFSSSVDVELVARIGMYGDWLHNVATQELRDANARGEPRRDMSCPPGTLGATLRAHQYFRNHFITPGKGCPRWGEFFTDELREVDSNDLTNFGMTLKQVRDHYPGPHIPGYDAGYHEGFGILLEDFLERFPEVQLQK